VSVVQLPSPVISERPFANHSPWKVLGMIHPQNPGVSARTVVCPKFLDPRDPEGVRVCAFVASNINIVFTMVQDVANCTTLFKAYRVLFV
jgi:hypothetical protein